MAEERPAATGAGDTTASGSRDAIPPDAPPLFGWATGSFHAAVLVAVLVAALHGSGAAGNLLGEVGTFPGALAYLYLWAVTLATTRRALRRSEVTPSGGIPDGRTALGTALLWGAITGLLFFAGLFAVVAVAALATAGLDAVPLVGFLLIVGGLLAAAIGALVGAILALLDLALLRAAALVTGDINGGES